MRSRVRDPYAQTEAAVATSSDPGCLGLDITTWTLERSGLLKEGGGWYYQTTIDVTSNDGDMLEVLDVLAMDVGVIGVFSDWPVTVTYYANCRGL